MQHKETWNHRSEFYTEKGKLKTIKKIFIRYYQWGNQWPFLLYNTKSSWFSEAVSRTSHSSEVIWQTEQQDLPSTQMKHHQEQPSVCVCNSHNWKCFNKANFIAICWKLKYKIEAKLRQLHLSLHLMEHWQVCTPYCWEPRACFCCGRRAFPSPPPLKCHLAFVLEQTNVFAPRKDHRVSLYLPGSGSTKWDVKWDDRRHMAELMKSWGADASKTGLDSRCQEEAEEDMLRGDGCQATKRNTQKERRGEETSVPGGKETWVEGWWTRQ